MSVYLRGKTWWIKYRAGGRVVRRSARTTSKREAQALERKLRSQPDAGVSDNTTYLDALNLWLPIAPESALSPARNTHEIYHVRLSQLPAAANRMAARMISDGLKPATVNRRLAVVRRILNLSYKEWDLIDSPLAEKVTRFSEKGSEREVFLTPPEATKLMAAIRNDQAREFLMLAMTTGLRQGEIWRLLPEYWHKPYIRLPNRTKSKQPRVVPVIEALYPVMDRLPFTLTPWELRVSFEEARDVAEMSHVRMHDLRHTYASWLMQDPTIPVTLVRDLMGHSSLAVTSKYSHLRAGGAEQVQAALARAMGHSQGTVESVQMSEKAVK